jgi:hypothetical protein
MWFARVVSLIGLHEHRSASLTSTPTHYIHEENTMRKIATGLLVMAAIAYAIPAPAATLFTENFGYALASALNGQGGWSAHSAGGTNPQTINTAGGLSYPGYAPSGVGNLLGPLATSGEDNNQAVAGMTGNVYAALMINVASSQTTGDYLFHYFDGLITGNIFRCRVFVKKDASTTNYALGIQFGSNGPPSYTGFVYTPGTTHLLVVKYTTVAGASNDIASLFIDPALDCLEPAANVTHTDATQTDAVGLGGIAIRQGTAANAASAQLDGIRVATSWTEAVCGDVVPTNTSTWGRVKSIYR